jgi:hypothetical protein
MLEAGVSSSLEIARFWGIAGERRTESRPAPRKEPLEAANDKAPEASGGSIGEQVMAAVGGHTPSGVQDIIAKALKSAGLMR